MTKVDLASQAQLSTRIVVAYESGHKQPTDQSLATLAQVLEFPVGFFSGPELDEPPVEGSSFRALTMLSARDRDRSLAAGAIALSFSDWIAGRFTVPQPDIPRYEAIQPEAAAQSLRTEWGLGERPIGNMIHLLESRGVRVFSLVEEIREIDAYSFWRADTPYVFLNSLKSAEHSRMDAAHELGHLVLHWKGGVRGRQAEHEAQQFGSAFLMPSGSIKDRAPRTDRIDHLISAKAYWKVSLAALAYRMHHLKILSDFQYRWLFVNITKAGYHKNEPQGCPRETSEVFSKVFRMLREDGFTISDIAHALTIHPEELNRLVFGLVLTSVK